MSEDNAFTFYSHYGSIVYLFSNTDYLDEASGGIVQRILQRHEELFIPVNLLPVKETDAIRAFSPFARECIFQEENLLGEYVEV